MSNSLDKVLYDVVDDIGDKLGFTLDKSVVKFIISSFCKKVSTLDLDINSICNTLSESYDATDAFDYGILIESLKGSVDEYSKEVICQTLKSVYDVVSAKTKRNKVVKQNISNDVIRTHNVIVNENVMGYTRLVPTEDDFADIDIDFSSIPKSSEVGISLAKVRTQNIEESNKVDSFSRRSTVDNVFAIDIGDVIKDESITPYKKVNTSGDDEDGNYTLQRSDASMLTDTSGTRPKPIKDEDLLDY